MATLNSYMSKNKLTFTKMEALTGINFRVLHRYSMGDTLPSLINAHKIYMATKGQIKLQDWFSPEYLKEIKEKKMNKAPLND